MADMDEMLGDLLANAEREAGTVEARRNRNTGPSVAARAPRSLNPRRAR